MRPPFATTCEDSDRNQTPSALDIIQHSWLLPATHKLLLLASRPLELPSWTPMELESAILFPQNSIVLAQVFSKLLGLEEPRREHLVSQADHTWIPALVKLVHEYRRECFEPLFIDKPQLFWLPSRRKGRMTSYLFYDWQTFTQLDPLDRLETLYLLAEVVLFELDTPLADKMRNMAPEKLRVEPLGLDAKGNCYWYFDDDCRIYMEEPLPFGTVAWNERGQQADGHSFWSSSNNRISTRSCKKRRMDEQPKDDDHFRKNNNAPTTLPLRSEQCSLEYDNYVPCFGQATRSISQWKVRVEGVSELQEMLSDWKDKRHTCDRQLRKRISSQLLPRWTEEEERIVKEREKREKKDWIPTCKRRSSRVLEKQSVQQEEEKEKEKEREKVEKIQKRRQRRQAERLAIMEVIEREREKEFGDLRLENSQTTPSAQQLGMQWRDIGIRQLRDKKRIPYMRLSDDEEDQYQVESLPSQFAIFFDESSVLPEYNHLLDDNTTIWRLVDRFALYSSKTGQMTAVEDLDKSNNSNSNNNHAHLFVLEGILIPCEEEDSESMPAAFRCDNIQDWCIEYGMEPRLWLKSSKGIWYQLKVPCKEYRNVFQSTRRKFELCSRIYILCMTLSPLVCSYSKIVEFLSCAYGEMKPYTEEEILMEASFILSQFWSLNEGRIVHSGFFRHLHKKYRQMVDSRERDKLYPSSWSAFTKPTLQWNQSHHGNRQDSEMEENVVLSSSTKVIIPYPSSLHLLPSNADQDTSHEWRLQEREQP